MTKCLEAELNSLENFRIGPECLDGTRLVSYFLLFKLLHGFATIGKRNRPAVPVPMNFRVHPPGQRVDNRDANPVQSTRHGVSATTELASSVQNRHDNLNGGKTLSWVDSNRNSTPVVRYPQATVLQDHHFDMVAVSCQGLIHSIVHNLVHQVMKSAFPCGTDVHSRTFTNGLQALKYGDVCFAVLCSIGLRAICAFCISGYFLGGVAHLLLPLPAS